METTTARQTLNPPAVLAAGWCGVFAILHVLWALGSDVGLGVGADAGMTGWFVAYDVVSAGLCLVGVALAVTLTREPSTRTAHTLALAAGVLLVVRGAAGVAQDAWTVLGGDVLSTTAGWDPWFLVGGALFLSAAWRARTAAAS